MHFIDMRVSSIDFHWIAIVGNEAEIKDRLQATVDAGADDIIVAEFGGDPDQRDRTRAAVAALL